MKWLDSARAEEGLVLMISNITVVVGSPRPSGTRDYLAVRGSLALAEAYCVPFEGPSTIGLD